MSKKSCLGVSGAAGDKLFFTRTAAGVSGDAGPGGGEPAAGAMPEEYMLGVIVGLACYNGVLVNLPLVDAVYKLFNGGQVVVIQSVTNFACSRDVVFNLLIMFDLRCIALF